MGKTVFLLRGENRTMKRQVEIGLIVGLLNELGASYLRYTIKRNPKEQIVSVTIGSDALPKLGYSEEHVFSYEEMLLLKEKLVTRLRTDRHATRIVLDVASRLAEARKSKGL